MAVTGVYGSFELLLILLLLFSSIVKNAKLSLSVPHCLVKFDYYPPVKEWIHICLVVNDEISTYLDGRKILPDKSCQIEDIDYFIHHGLISLGRKLTPNQLTNNFEPDKYILESGTFVDTRFYPSSLNSKEIHKVWMIERSSKYFIRLINFSEKYGTITQIHKIRKISVNHFINFTSQYNIIVGRNFMDTASVIQS